MAALLDRLLLFLISILMFNVNQADYLVVGLILVVIIMEGVCVYLRDKRVVMAVSVVSILIALWQPSFTAFFPLLIYECVNSGLYLIVPAHVLLGLLSFAENTEYGIVSKETGMIILLMLVGLTTGISARREKALKDKIHNLQDEESYLVQKNRQNHEELMMKQDYEIHAATLTERNRIAREIHDHVGHMLSRSILQLGAILSINKDEKLDAPLRSLKDTLDTAMNNIRESVHDLKDDSLDLEYMVKEITGQYETLKISIDYDMGQFLPKEIKYCFIAIVKEALTNTVKHSDSTKVNIVMREHPALYQVLIEDNGSGSDKIKNINAGIGLENMRDRVNAFGGNISFSGENGFRIFITIPKEV